jgi:Outer membrane lipoprotein-sorting protein
MNRTMIVFLGAAGAFLMTAGAAMAQDGRQIMEEVQKRQKSTSMRYEGTIQTVQIGTKHIVTKHWTSARLGVLGSSKTIIRFTGPPEVKGVALLVVNHPTTASDEWFWRPSVGREQRIAVQDRSQRFLGTDFSYEDLEERDVDQYDYKLTGEAGGQWRIDAHPRKPSQYTHLYFFVDKTMYVFNQVEGYFKKGGGRTIDYTNYKQVQGIWTPSAVLIVDGIAKSRTVLTYDKVEYNLPMKDEDFTVEALRRGD